MIPCGDRVDVNGWGDKARVGWPLRLKFYDRRKGLGRFRSKLHNNK